MRNSDEHAWSRAEPCRQADQLRDVLLRLTHSQEDERHRIAADIHDGVAQLIVGARFEIFASRRALSSGRHDLAESRLGRSQHLLDEAVDELYRVIFNLRPKLLDELGLVDALREYIQLLRDEDGDTVWHLETIGTSRPLAPHVELAIFRTVQEGLNNAPRHASASHIGVELRFSDASDEVVVTVKNDGIDFRPGRRAGARRSQLGLLAMQDRAASIDGSLTIQAGERGGTEIVLRVPCQTREPAAPPRPHGQWAS